MKTKLFQIVVNHLATKYIFDLTQKEELVDKMIELQKQYPLSKITFLTIEI